MKTKLDSRIMQRDVSRRHKGVGEEKKQGSYSKRDNGMKQQDSEVLVLSVYVVG